MSERINITEDHSKREILAMTIPLFAGTFAGIYHALAEPKGFPLEIMVSGSIGTVLGLGAGLSANALLENLEVGRKKSGELLQGVLKRGKERLLASAVTMSRTIPLI